VKDWSARWASTNLARELTDWVSATLRLIWALTY
jgi:hypothetical protein